MVSATYLRGGSGPLTNTSSITQAIQILTVSKATRISPKVPAGTWFRGLIIRLGFWGWGMCLSFLLAFFLSS